MFKKKFSLLKAWLTVARTNSQPVVTTFWNTRRFGVILCAQRMILIINKFSGFPLI